MVEQEALFLKISVEVGEQKESMNPAESMSHDQSVAWNTESPVIGELPFSFSLHIG